MKKLILISALLLFASNGWAEEPDVEYKYKTVLECGKEEAKGCQVENCVAIAMLYCQRDVEYPNPFEGFASPVEEKDDKPPIVFPDKEK